MPSGGPAPPPRPAPAPIPSGSGGGAGGHRRRDRIRLEYMLRKFLGLSQPELARSPIYIALITQGIREFNGGFVLMTTDAVNQLYVPTLDGRQILLPFHHKMMVTALLQFYHMKSRAISKPADLTSVTKADFDRFRTTMFDPSQPIVPWHRPRPDSHLSAEERARANWNKTIKPSKSDYVVFKEEVYWFRFKEDFSTTARSHGLFHTLDINHVPIYIELDKEQMLWMLSVMKKCFQAHNARLIVNKNLSHGNTRIIWDLVCKAYDNSMTADLKSQQILTWLTQTQLHTNGWSGTQESFLTFFQDQVRLHDEINKKYPLPNNQACNFLQAAVSGTPNLASVYQTWNINNRSGTDPSERELQFSEYVQLLILNAQVHDAGKKNRPKTPKIDVNLTDLAFEDIETDETVREINEHDIDPSYGHLEVNVNDTKRSPAKNNMTTKTGSKKVFVDRDTWRSLSQADRTAWDKLTDGAKTKIVGYGIKKGK